MSLSMCYLRTFIQHFHILSPYEWYITRILQKTMETKRYKFHEIEALIWIYLLQDRIRYRTTETDEALYDEIRLKK